MPYVINRKWSKHWDMTTDTQLDPVLDVRAGMYIAAAHVDSKKAKLFGKHPDYEVLTDDEYRDLTTAPVEEGPDLTEPLTGEPLTDAALVKNQAAGSVQTEEEKQQNGPPEPPPSS
jgi:hypothetical protein